MTFDVEAELRKLVSYDTVNDPKSDKRPTIACPRYINSRLEEYGFECKLLESKGYFTSLGIRGNAGPKILFLAHFDVVPPGSDWATDPFELTIQGDVAYGRGTSDNKGNIVSMLMMAEKFASAPSNCTLILAATGDEEIGGANGALILSKHLEESGLYPDYVIVADGVNQVIIHRRRNVLPAIIKARRTKSIMRGRKERIRFDTLVFGSESRHSAYQRPGVDRHSLLAASKYLDLHGYSMVSSLRGDFVKSNVIPGWVELEILHPDEEGEEFEYDPNLTGLIRSLLPLSSVFFPTEYSDVGTVISPNLFELEADSWTVYFDIRAMTNDGKPIEKAFRKALEGRVEVDSIKVHDGIGYVNSDPDSKLIRTARTALAKEGIKHKVMEGYGASDSRYFTGKGADVFDFGPRGGNLHGPNEWVSLSSISENARFFQLLVQDLSMK